MNGRHGSIDWLTVTYSCKYELQINTIQIKFEASMYVSFHVRHTDCQFEYHVNM